MAGETGLRERKKAQTSRHIWDVAIDLFLAHGFEHVSVAQIAGAAEVSKMTVFNYFGTKEDLVLSPMEEHLEDVARTVRDRFPGETPVAALHRQFLEMVERRDPSIGLTDNPRVLAVRRLVAETPVLARRAVLHGLRGGKLLKEVLAEETGDRALAAIASAQLMGVRNELILDNHRRLLAGQSLEEAAAASAELAATAFALLERGLGGYAPRESRVVG